MFKWLSFLGALFAGRAHSPAAADGSPESDSSLRYLVENSGDVIIRSGPDLLMSYVSPSVTYLLGYQPEELIGTRPDSLIFCEDMGIIAEADQALRSGRSKATVTTVRVRHRDGSTIWMESTARLVEGLTDQGPDISVIMRDVTYRKRIEDELAEQALKDGLTGLANRRAFDSMLDREWQRTLHEGHPTSLLLLDVDHFKIFNDQLGHQVGDDCLRAVAAAVERARELAGGDCVAAAQEAVVGLGGAHLLVTHAILRWSVACGPEVPQPHRVRRTAVQCTRRARGATNRADRRVRRRRVRDVTGSSSG